MNKGTAYTNKYNFFSYSPFTQSKGYSHQQNNNGHPFSSNPPVCINYTDCWVSPYISYLLPNKGMQDIICVIITAALHNQMVLYLHLNTDC